MRRTLLAALGAMFLAPIFLLALAGCGGDAGKDVTQSPEAKAADNQGQDAMKEFMQSKGASKKK